MSNPAFPLSNRPRLDLAGEPQDNRVRSNVDAGPAKMRARFTASVEAWEFTLGPITGPDLTTLMTWYGTTLVQGTLPFDWRDRTGTAATFRWVKPPKWRAVVGHSDNVKRRYEVKCSLEIMP